LDGSQGIITAHPKVFFYFYFSLCIPFFILLNKSFSSALIFLSCVLLHNSFFFYASSVFYTPSSIPSFLHCSSIPSPRWFFHPPQCSPLPLALSFTPSTSLLRPPVFLVPDLLAALSFSLSRVVVVVCVMSSAGRGPELRKTLRDDGLYF